MIDTQVQICGRNYYQCFSDREGVELARSSDLPPRIFFAPNTLPRHPQYVPMDIGITWNTVRMQICLNSFIVCHDASCNWLMNDDKVPKLLHVTPQPFIFASARYYRSHSKSGKEVCIAFASWQTNVLQPYQPCGVDENNHMILTDMASLSQSLVTLSTSLYYACLYVLQSSSFSKIIV